MRRREGAMLAAAFFSCVLGGCNSARPPEPGPAPASQSMTPPDFRLPEGSGCGGAIARYRAIMDNDLSMGHVDKSVYDKIQSEIGEAQSACAAGQDSKATALLRASKARHGYPA